MRRFQRSRGALARTPYSSRLPWPKFQPMRHTVRRSGCSAKPRWMSLCTCSPTNGGVAAWSTVAWLTAWPLPMKNPSSAASGTWVARTGQPGRKSKLRWSVGVALTCWVGWWACQDLNLGPHPYQLNAGNRCADRPFPSSLATVGAKGMRSISPLVCVHSSAFNMGLASVVHASRSLALEAVAFGGRS
jgi:hypothetical protein